MKLKNISSRLHHVGNVSIAPGMTVAVDDSFAGQYNERELELVEGPAKAPKAPAKAPAPKAAPAPAPAPAGSDAAVVSTPPWAPPKVD